MPNAPKIEITAYPALPKLYKDMIFHGAKKLTPGQPLPELPAVWNNAKAAPAQLAAYNALCGFPQSDTLPITYPHILIFGLQVAILSHPEFPLKPMGTVHQRQHIHQRRPIHVNEAMDLTCRIGAQRVVKAGLEFDMISEVTIQGETVWQGVSAYLSRGNRFGDPGDPHPWSQINELETPAPEKRWRIPNDLGKRYARASRDYNPIHVSRILAKLFGFKRDIIHGFWTASRCLSELPPIAPEDPVRYDILLKGPVFIGSEVRFLPEATNPDRFDLFCGNNPRPVLRGKLTRGQAAGNQL